jgi:hypothetical protein
VRPLLVAFAACVFAAAPAALLAQQLVPPHAPQQPIVHPIPPVRPRPVPTHSFNHHGNQFGYSVGVYPTVIVNATPAPASKHKATPRPQFAEDVFETHSTDDAK